MGGAAEVTGKALRLLAEAGSISSVERLVNHGHHRLLLGGLLDGMRHGLGGIGGGHGGKLPG